MSEYLPRVNLENASFTLYDKSQELIQTRMKLDMNDNLGNVWTNNYDPGQAVLSNQVGSRYVLLQFSNGCLQN